MTEQHIKPEEAALSAPTFAGYLVLAALIAFVAAAVGFKAGGLWSPKASSLEGALHFDTEASKVTRTLGCRDVKTMPALYEGGGRLYGCIMGRAATAKLFINEDGSQPGTVEDIKVMWNNWQRDIGHGLHADRRDAIRMVRAFAQLYAPTIEEELVTAFQGTERRSYTAGQYRISFRWDRGPAIDEHLLTLAPR